MYAANQMKYALEHEFCKGFTLKTGWRLPSSDHMYTKPKWELADFQRLKYSLNCTKEKLNSYDLDQWHAHTSKMNPAGLVISHVRNHVRPDFLTQAWCKFYEIACDLPLRFLDGGAVLNSVHLCEAPGAFVSSLNHYVALNHQRSKLEWLAMTLNPYHECNGHPDTVTDDRLILDTLDNWVFGPDYTGDIFQPGYAEHLRQSASAKFGAAEASLVTADGSVDCSDDPNEQETTVARLQDYETMVALDVLCAGGSLVLKMFTAFECNTICRMYLLCCVFRSVVVRKPATSKPGNSEVYAVCTGYAGRSVALPYVRRFFAANEPGGRGTSQWNASAFPLSQIPVDFRRRLYKCCEYFARLQIRTIEHNIYAWSRKERSYRAMEALQRAMCREFVARLGLRAIRRDQQLRPNSRTPKRPPSREKDGNDGLARRHKSTDNNRKRRSAGPSYAEKVQLRNADVNEEAAAMYQELMRCDELPEPHSRSNRVCWTKRERLTVDPSDVRYRTGKPVAAIKGSKFCSEPLIRCRVRVLSKFPAVKSATDAESRRHYYRLKLGRPDIVVCDLTVTCAAHRDDQVALQYNCLRAVTAALRDLDAADDLLIVGYPLYTQLSVSCFFAVASTFDAHGLLEPDRHYGHAFVFSGYRRHDGWLDALNEAKGRLSPASDDAAAALISFIPIRMLFEQSAYSDIVAVNDLCILHEIEPILLSSMNRASSVRPSE